WLAVLHSEPRRCVRSLVSEDRTHGRRLPPISKEPLAAFGLTMEACRGDGIRVPCLLLHRPPRPRRSDSGLEHPDIASMEGRQRIGRQTLLPKEGAFALRFPWQVARSLRALRLLSTHRRNQRSHAPNRSRDSQRFLSLQGEFPSPQRLWLRGPRSFQSGHSYNLCIQNNRRGAISASHVAT